MILPLLLSALVSLSLANVPERYCGKYDRMCGYYAECVDGKSIGRRYDQCQCIEGYQGCPLVMCHYPDQYQCVMKSDPHLVGFALPRASLNWPCRYRLTRVQHPLKGATPGLAFCSLEVFGNNEVIDGRYFASGVEISFAIGDFANQIFYQLDIIKFDISLDGLAVSDGTFSEWGTGVHSTWNGIDVFCYFDTYFRLATLVVPQCEFYVSFRPFNPYQPTGPQAQVPAISIVVGNETLFGKSPIGTYPDSLCGETVVQGDDTLLYVNRSEELGLRSDHQALLYDALDQNLVQQALVAENTSSILQNSEMCQASVDEFAKCSPANKRVAIRRCAGVLKKFADCLGIEALEAFNACVEATCVNQASGCVKYYAAVGGCEESSRRVNKFCGGGIP